MVLELVVATVFILHISFFSYVELLNLSQSYYVMGSDMLGDLIINVINCSGKSRETESYRQTMKTKYFLKQLKG